MIKPFSSNDAYQPRGDQGQAIAKLIKSVEAGNRHQTLLGVTGSGKTFTVANVIREVDRPTLVISHNKTLAAQLYSEFKQFFPHNAVEYFVSYFDYYQPEAYIPRTDTYIEKDSSINEEIERLRLSTTSALLARRDVIVVASVSCIYGLGSPEDYMNMLLTMKIGQKISREAVLAKLVDMLYERNDIAFARGRFPRARRCGRGASRRTSTRRRSASSFSAMKSIASRASIRSPACARNVRRHHALSREAVRDALRQTAEGDAHDPRGDGRADHRVRKTGQAPRSAAAQDAHGVRPRDDAGDGILQRDRKLLAPSQRAPTRLAAVHAARFFPEGLPAA